MRLIAHRGLRYGPDKNEENKPRTILDTLKDGFDVECDVWYVNSNWWLGHDEPQYRVYRPFIELKGLWLHCKNYEALDKLSSECPIEQLHYFWHQKDRYTLTSRHIPWIYPGNPIIQNGVCVLPEETLPMYDIVKLDTKVFAVCSDYVGDIRKFMEKK